MSPHTVSALKEIQVKWRVSHLIIAVLLTVLDGIVAVYYGKAIWIAWSPDLPARGLLVFFPHWKPLRFRMYRVRVALACASCRRARMPGQCGT
jgi:hypothetical protein